MDKSLPFICHPMNCIALCAKNTGNIADLGNLPISSIYIHEITRDFLYALLVERSMSIFYE